MRCQPEVAAWARDREPAWVLVAAWEVWVLAVVWVLAEAGVASQAASLRPQIH